MKDWAYTFDRTGKEAWMQQIERDLKGSTIASLHAEWWPGVALEPLHHKDDHHPIVHLPDHLFTSPPIIAEWVDARGLSATDLNKLLLDAVKFGTALFIITTDEKKSFDGGAWLEGIHAEMVEWHFIGDQVSPAYKPVWTRASGNVYYRIARTLDNNIDQWFERPAAFLTGCKLAYHFPSEGNWVEQCAAVFNTLLSDAGRWQNHTVINSFFEQCILSAEAATDYLKGIIQLRTLHVVWRNLLALQDHREENQQPAHLESHIMPRENESPDHYLIRATTAALGSALAGAQVICIHPHSTTKPDHYRRINRNVHHLLHMEGGLPKQRDPLAGAYAIDHYTADWSARIWDLLDL